MEEFENPMRPRNPVGKRMAKALLACFVAILGGLGVVWVLGLCGLPGKMVSAAVSVLPMVGIGAAVIAWKETAPK